MAVIKVFDSVGTKTVIPMGNLEEQSYDPVVVFEKEDLSASEDTEAEE